MRAGNSKPQRSTIGLSSKLDKNLTAYMAAAGVAGVGMLALAQSAEAKVVYTPTRLLTTLGVFRWTLMATALPI